MRKKKIAIHPFQLLDISIADARIKVLKDQIPEKQPKLGLDVSTTSKLLSEDTAHIFLNLKVVFTEGDPSFDFKLKLKGIIKAINPCSKKDLQQFIDNQVVPLLWPFARELVYTLTNRMGFPPLMLPTINVYQTIDKNLKKGSSE